VPEHLDVLIIGAGVSGIGAACHLQARHPGRSYAILEARDAIGGTWDLFRFPGVRSDSDVHTFAYAFKPWVGEKAIVDGAAIRAYVEETAREHGVDRHIRFGCRVVRASWSSETALWTAEVDGGPDVTARWLFCATGYYRYDEGYTPHLPGVERFEGPVVHPQHWPQDLDHAGRRIVVLGSGATAVTLVPALAETAGHVTMLQRSPSYVLPQPSRDPVAAWLRGRVSPERAYAIVRRKNIAQQAAVYRLCQRFPRATRRLIRRINAQRLPPDCPVDVHFKPAYDPWDQRLCVVPDGDLFRALRNGTASVVTDQVATFTERGVRLASGAELEADVLVTATGLELLAFGGIELVVDGREIVLPETLAYRGAMLGGVPNFTYAIGYTNASWTLKVDLVCEFLCRVLAELDARGVEACVPEPPPSGAPTRPLLDFQAGYVLRALDRFPRQGVQAPWRLAMSYYDDVRNLRRGPVDDGTLRWFSAARTPTVAA
jgi:cation diffusion facilitator CzcD-associated flavoprotein CzcO